MNNLKKSTQIILKELATRYPDSTEFRKNAIVEVGKEFGYTGKDWDPLMQKNNRVKIGTYDLAGLIEPLRETMLISNTVVKRRDDVRARRLRVGSIRSALHAQHSHGYHWWSVQQSIG